MQGKLRVDSYLSSRLDSISRSRIKDCIANGKVHVNNAVQLKAAHALKVGDMVSCAAIEPKQCTAEPEAIPLDIVYEDSSVVVVNKAAGVMLTMVCTA